MKYIVILFFVTIFCCCVNAQQINGIVYGSDQNNVRTTLPAANVYWEGTEHGVTTDREGKFSIEIPQTGKSRLIASFVGYQNDTIDVPAGANRIEVV
jgi:hypothetical protein